jgi:hypothetical protein
VLRTRLCVSSSLFCDRNSLLHLSNCQVFLLVFGISVSTPQSRFEMSVSTLASMLEYPYLPSRAGLGPPYLPSRPCWNIRIYPHVQVRLFAPPSCPIPALDCWQCGTVGANVSPSVGLWLSDLHSFTINSQRRALLTFGSENSDYEIPLPFHKHITAACCFMSNCEIASLR